MEPAAASPVQSFQPPAVSSPQPAAAAAATSPAPVDPKLYQRPMQAPMGEYPGTFPPAAQHFPTEVNRRLGQWTREEEAYAEKVAELFKTGRVPNCPEGTTMRALLADLLNCAPMRVSKKFSGERAIGKCSYKRVKEDLSKEEADVRPLEQAFHDSVRGMGHLKMSLAHTSNLITPVAAKEQRRAARLSSQHSQQQRDLAWTQAAQQRDQHARYMMQQHQMQGRPPPHYFGGMPPMYHQAYGQGQVYVPGYPPQAAWGRDAAYPGMGYAAGANGAMPPTGPGGIMPAGEGVPASPGAEGAAAEGAANPDGSPAAAPASEGEAAKAGDPAAAQAAMMQQMQGMPPGMMGYPSPEMQAQMMAQGYFHPAYGHPGMGPPPGAQPPIPPLGAQPEGEPKAEGDEGAPAAFDGADAPADEAAAPAESVEFAP